MYLLIQTVIIFLLGSTNVFIINKNLNFIITLVIMLIFASLLFKFMLKPGRNIFLSTTDRDHLRNIILQACPPSCKS